MQGTITNIAKSLKLNDSEALVVQSYFIRNSKNINIQIDIFNILYICNLSRLLSLVLNTASESKNVIDDSENPQDISSNFTKSVQESISY